MQLFGTLIQSEQHTLVTIGNIVRRVLYLIREEYIQGLKATSDSTNNEIATPSTAMSSSVFQALPQQQDHQPNLANLLEMGPEVDFNKTLGDFDNGTHFNKFAILTIILVDFKANVIEGINELISELEDLYKSVSDVAAEHIHTKYVLFKFFCFIGNLQKLLTIVR